jgi:hydrogenase nickel incorporation protein HypB
MCETCGCATQTTYQVHSGLTTPLAHHHHNHEQRRTVEVMEDLLASNDRAAAHNRAHFDRHDVLAINLMSAPGSGKTSLLEATIVALHKRYRMAVIEGDLATENDAARIRAKGVPAVQITTGQACHLDAEMIHGALHQLDLAQLDIVFIENVGNLVCPASFDLGQHANVVLLSVPEGDDKPAKYPVMFRKADLVLITKADLFGLIDGFDAETAKAHIRDLANDAPVHLVSTRKVTALDAWLDWVEARIDTLRQTGAVTAETDHRPIGP